MKIYDFENEEPEEFTKDDYIVKMGLAVDWALCSENFVLVEKIQGLNGETIDGKVIETYEALLEWYEGIKL